MSPSVGGSPACGDKSSGPRRGVRFQTGAQRPPAAGSAGRGDEVRLTALEVAVQVERRRPGPLAARRQAGGDLRLDGVDRATRRAKIAPGPLVRNARAFDVSGGLRASLRRRAVPGRRCRRGRNASRRRRRLRTLPPPVFVDHLAPLQRRRGHPHGVSQARRGPRFRYDFEARRRAPPPSKGVQPEERPTRFSASSGSMAGSGLTAGR